MQQHGKYGSTTGNSPANEENVTEPFHPLDPEESPFPGRDGNGSRCATNAFAGATSRSRFSTDGEDKQRRGQRLNFLGAGGALLFGAAVFGLAYHGRPETSSVTPMGRGSSTLVNVFTPRSGGDRVETASAPPQAQPFPKVTPQTQASEGSAIEAGGAAGGGLAPLSFQALNFYHIRDGKPAQDYPWLKDVKLIEPYRETTLSVSSPRDGYEYVWEVRGEEAENKGVVLATGSGPEAIVILTVLDANMVTLKEVDSDGVVARQLDEMVMVKYVRREIRTLTDDEREELFDAMYQLWAVRVNGGEGKELYGDDFADIYAINRLHFKAAMNNDCDHFHDGMGFLTSHSLITNTFEYSLQQVNPKLTVPYWDFTMEEVEAEVGLDDDDVKIKSPMFREDWFGSADPADNVVKDGRWAYTKIPAMYGRNPGELVPDIYGLLRSRWNVNDSPYLTRGMGTLCNTYDVTQVYMWPTCAVHYEMATEYPDFYSYIWDVSYAPHGPVHTWIGGVVNCEETIEVVSALVGSDNADALALYAFDQRKNFWRDGYFECEGLATRDQSIDDVFSSGMCGCLGYDLSQGDDWKTIYYNSTIAFDDVISDYDDDTKRQVVAAVCASTIHDGDHLQAGSSLDPTFWPMHPTMERLFMFGLLTDHMTDLTWPDTDDGSSSTMISRYGDSCVGHSGSDVFPFGLLETDTDGFEIKTGIKGSLKTGNMMTNREVLAAIDARVNMLPYVYDTFKWEHCMNVGVNFDEAWDTSTSDKTKTSKRSRNGPSFTESGLGGVLNARFGSSKKVSN